MQIKVLDKKSPNGENVFEKSGVKVEFTLSELEAFLNDLDKQENEVSLQLVQMDTQLSKLQKPNVDIKKKDEFDFMVYCNSKLQVQVANEAIANLDEEKPHFEAMYEEIEHKEDAPKFLRYAAHKENLEKEVEVIKETREDYLADKEKAESCLETTSQK